MQQLTLPDAREFAIKAHGDQKYGDAPYVLHLRAVVNVLKRFGVCTPTLEAAAWLHDTLEDTGAVASDIEELFGREVLALVQAVTDKPGANRRERALKTYPKIRAAGIDAVTLKLADRIANVEYSLSNSSPQLSMYRREWVAFYDGLCTGGERNEMWDCLRGLLK